MVVLCVLCQMSSNFLLSVFQIRLLSLSSLTTTHFLDRNGINLRVDDSSKEATSEFIKIAKKKFGDNFFGDFLFEERGSGGSPVSSSVVKPKPERSESPKKAKSRKKMKRPTTAGAACRRAQRPATPAHPRPHAVNCQIKES